MSLAAREVVRYRERASWIRKMFEEGRRLKEQYGEEQVHDFSLGNPNLEPPEAVQARLRKLVNNPAPGQHVYMPNPGYPKVREVIANHISTRQALPEPLTADHVVMTCGAAGGLNVLFKAILNPEDEVLVPAPFFSEYIFYAENGQGKLVPVDTLPDFQLDLAKMEAAINIRTKVVLIDSPNNPTGVVYTKETLVELQELLARKEKEFGHAILLVSDEPYVELVYDNVVVPSVLEIFPHSAVVTSFSKNLGLAGERIGYVALSPRLEKEEASEVFSNMAFAIRILGFVNAPALMQHLVGDPEILEAVVDLQVYRARRDVLYHELTGMGYQCVKPQGAFYLFPETPIDDDLVFCQEAKNRLLLVVPGRGFGSEGHVRIAFAMTDLAQIERALPVFQDLAHYYGLS